MRDLTTLLWGKQVIVLDKFRDTTTAGGFSITRVDDRLQ